MWRWFVQSARLVDGCRGVTSSPRVAILGEARPFNSRALLAPSHSELSSTSSVQRRSRASRQLASGDDLSTSSLDGQASTRSATKNVEETEDDKHVMDPSHSRVAIPSSQRSSHPHSMAELREFLYSQGPAPTLTISQIRRRYISWAVEGTLRDLSAQDMSLLIRLFGTLSVTEQGHPSKALYVHPMASQMQPDALGSHWDMITHIVGHKRWLKYPLHHSDHYWLLRRNLARYWEHRHSNPQRAERALAGAKKHYLALVEHSSHPLIHVPYYSALVASGSNQSTEDIMTGLLALFSRPGPCHSSVVDILMRVILRFHASFSHPSKQAILRALGHRASVLGNYYQLDATTSETYQSSQHTPPDLLEALKHGLLGPGFPNTAQHSRMDDRLLRWGSTIATRVFALKLTSEDTVNFQWNCLTLFALAWTRSTEGQGHSSSSFSGLVQHSAVVEWQTVCVLSAMSSNLTSEAGDSSLPDEVLRGFQAIVRAYWRDWTNIPPSTMPARSILVSRLMCAAFLRLGGLLKDNPLVEACRRFGVATELWSFQPSQSHTRDGLPVLAAEQLYATLACGTFFERALVDLMASADYLPILCPAVDSTILRYAQSNPEQAHELLVWSAARGVSPSIDVVGTVGVALARRGVSHCLQSYLTNPRLPPEGRARVLSAHLQMYARYGSRFMDHLEAIEATRQAFDLVGKLDDATILLPKLEDVVMAFIRCQRAPQILQLVEDVVAHQPSLLSEAFCTRVLRSLLYHGRYKLAQRAFERLLLVHPPMRQLWTSIILTGLARGGAHRLATSFVKSSPSSSQPFTLPAALKPARAVRFRTRAPKANTTLPLPSIARRAADSPDVQLESIKLLARARRLFAAKSLFADLCAREPSPPPGFRTAMANTILHGYLSRPRGPGRQQLRSVLRAYKVLKEPPYGFEPDHVTVHILIRAHLREGTDVDAAAARKLMNDLLRIGYPGGPHATGSDMDVNNAGSGALQRGDEGNEVEVAGFKLPRVKKPLRLQQDVVPLYKTFVTAFYRFDDLGAARKVVEILRTLRDERWVDQRRRAAKGGSTSEV